MNEHYKSHSHYYTDLYFIWCINLWDSCYMSAIMHVEFACALRSWESMRYVINGSYVINYIINQSGRNKVKLYKWRITICEMILSFLKLVIIDWITLTNYIFALRSAFLGWAFFYFLRECYWGWCKILTSHAFVWENFSSFKEHSKTFHQIQALH